MATSPKSAAHLTPTGDPWLLTPGPLTTAPAVKEAMLHDYGSRDARFIAMNRRVRDRLAAIVGAPGYTAVPLQGSGSFVVEAMIGTFVPADGKLLILVNGAYGQRIAKICEYYGISTTILECAENEPVDPAGLDDVLANDSAITHVAAVHCETTTGILNPIKAVADVVARHGKSLLIDAMSAFGAIPLDAREVAFDAVAASSNKCLEGVPGMGFCIAREDALKRCQGNSRSLTLDLFDQWQAMEKNGQWRFTPPVQVIAAFDEALNIFEANGGVAGRGGRYAENCRALISGMRALGFETLLPDDLQAPIIVTFLTPADPAFDFQTFYDSLSDKGFVIYPGKLTVADTFRIGCIGDLGAEEIGAALKAIVATLAELGINNCAANAA
ncbi:MAG: 2-aminoethylphosphonate--pyruvate transaminase [Rhodospirillales bacterium]